MGKKTIVIGLLARLLVIYVAKLAPWSGQGWSEVNMDSTFCKRLPQTNSFLFFNGYLLYKIKIVEMKEVKFQMKDFGEENI